MVGIPENETWNIRKYIVYLPILFAEADDEYGLPILTVDLLNQIAKIENVLTEPSGCVLLGGKVGSGRKTAVKIISRRQNIPIYMPKFGEIYSEKNFKNDLKNVWYFF